MKLQQLHEDAVALQEGLFQRAVAAAAVAVSALTAGHFMTDKPQNNVATGHVVDQLASQKGISPAKMAQIVDQVSQRKKHVRMRSELHGLATGRFLRSLGSSCCAYLSNSAFTFGT